MVSIILDRLPNTIILFTTSVILAALVGVFLGKIASWEKGSKKDVWMTIVALASHTVFVPWLALILIWIFAYKLGWFPITGMISEEVWLDPDSGPLAKLLDIFYHMILPLTTLFLIHFGSYLLIMRTSMLETLKEDYILTARAKGPYRESGQKSSCRTQCRSTCCYHCGDQPCLFNKRRGTHGNSFYLARYWAGAGFFGQQ